MITDPRVQRILDWRESLAVLSDESFFRIIRMYLGEVKTPYNKQKLIESLGSFVRNDKNQKNMIALLSVDDLKILTVIHLIKDADESKLISFFAHDTNPSVLKEHIVNLKERLLIYSYKTSKDNQILLDINPLIEDSLSPFLKQSVIFAPEIMEDKSEYLSFYISPEYIASYLAFVSSYSDICKNDGDFKKGAVKRLKEIFLSSKEDEEGLKVIYSLNRGLCNLNILHDIDKGIVIDYRRLELFTTIPHNLQLCYIAVASCGFISRSLLQSTVQLLLDTLSSLPENGYTLKKILQLSFLVQNRNKSDLSQRSSRFAQLMQKSEQRSGFSESRSSASLMESVLDVCALFGILVCRGRNIDGEEVYALSPSFLQSGNGYFEDGMDKKDALPKVLNIDAGFTITLMPGLGLKELVSLIAFLDIVKFDTVLTFEINKISVLRGFDRGLTSEALIETLASYTSYQIPQNLKISIEEWFASYMSAALYKGYVLKVNRENEMLVKSNALLKPYLKVVLSPGVFLFNFSDDEEAQSVIAKSGLSFVGSIKSYEEEKEVLSLPPVHFNGVNRQGECQCNIEESILLNMREQKKLLEEYQSYVDSLDVDEDLKMGLKERINGRIIVNKEQLRPESVRYEKLEAFGMDYAGKLHVIESAITNDCMIELDIEGQKETLVGRPSNFNKKTGDFLLMLEPDHKIVGVEVKNALRIKRLRSSLYG